VHHALQEPIAAGMAYGVNSGPDDCQPAILVFDLGGGTFDVSLLQSFDGILEVVSSEGDTVLGGLDLDLLIAEALVTRHFPPGAFICMLF
jgi:molecular chaperone DnaK (HSP70)